MKKIIRIDERTFRKMVDNMVLEGEKDKEFKKALAWLDRTKSIDGDFYDKIFQLMFISHIPRKNSRSRMDSFMKGLTRNDK